MSQELDQATAELREPLTNRLKRTVVWEEGPMPEGYDRQEDIPINSGRQGGNVPSSDKKLVQDVLLLGLRGAGVQNVAAHYGYPVANGEEATFIVTKLPVGDGVDVVGRAREAITGILGRAPVALSPETFTIGSRIEPATSTRSVPAGPGENVDAVAANGQQYKTVQEERNVGVITVTLLEPLDEGKRRELKALIHPTEKTTSPAPTTGSRPVGETTPAPQGMEPRGSLVSGFDEMMAKSNHRLDAKLAKMEEAAWTRNAEWGLFRLDYTEASIFGDNSHIMRKDRLHQRLLRAGKIRYGEMREALGGEMAEAVRALVDAKDGWLQDEKTDLQRLVIRGDNGRLRTGLQEAMRRLDISAEVEVMPSVLTNGKAGADTVVTISRLDYADKLLPHAGKDEEHMRLLIMSLDPRSRIGLETKEGVVLFSEAPPVRMER